MINSFTVLSCSLLLRKGSFRTLSQLNCHVCFRMCKCTITSLWALLIMNFIHRCVCLSKRPHSVLLRDSSWPSLPIWQVFCLNDKGGTVHIRGSRRYLHEQSDWSKNTRVGSKHKAEGKAVYMYRKHSQTAVDIRLHLMKFFIFIFRVYLATLTKQAFDWRNRGTARKKWVRITGLCVEISTRNLPGMKQEWQPL